jgi:hypothetical protein
MPVVRGGGGQQGLYYARLGWTGLLCSVVGLVGSTAALDAPRGHRAPGRVG